MKKWTFVLFIGLAAVSFAQDPGFAPRRSAEFLHRYEANSADPLVENSGEWESPYFAPEQLAMEPGIIQVRAGMNRFWRLTPALLAELDHSKGWTMEVRVRVLEQSGARGAIALAVDDEPGQPGVLSGLQIYSRGTQFALDGVMADSSANDDGFHTFRIAEAPGSRLVHAWRDGRYLGSASYPYYMINLPHFLLFGSWSGRIGGVAEVDYIRWDPAGPWAPAAPLLQFSTADGVIRLREEGPGRATLTAALGQAPAAPVTLTLRPGAGISQAEEVDLGAGPGASIALTFTPDNWSVPQSVTILAIDDTLAEWDHTCILEVQAASADLTFDRQSEMVTLYLVDNDEVLRIAESGVDTQVYENGATSDSYEIHFGMPPTQAVTIAFHFDPRRLSVAGSRVSPAQVTIEPAATARPLAIQVQAVDNQDKDLLKHSRIRHQISSGDPVFARAKLAELAVRVVENDKQHTQPESFTIPLIDLDQPDRQVVVDRQPGQYLGHVTTTLLEDSTTMLAVYPKGHGRGPIVYKRSFDAGLTWSRALPTPASWATSLEVPTIFRMTDPQGKERLILFSGLYPARRAYSEDNGLTWSELEQVGDWGGIVVMGCAIRLKDGRYMAMFHDDGRFFTANGKVSDTFTVYKVYSPDGGLTWGTPIPIIESEWSDPCEPGIFRSPDGRQLLVLLRENSRNYNSFYITSEDEGETWSPMIELPAALTGDRHTGQYTRDGRLFISFRDMAKGSPTWGDWVGWLGTYDDIINGREGQYRIRLKDNTYSGDTAYPGVECLPSGMLVTTTYGHWITGEQPYIVSTRFKPEELTQRFAPLPAAPCKIVAFGNSTTAPRQVDGVPVKVYADHLAADLPLAGIAATVVNKGIVGNTTDDARLRFEQDVLAEKPDLVIMQFGINDAIVHIWKTPPVLEPAVPLERYIGNLTDMVRQLKERNIRVLLMTSNPICWSDWAIAKFALPVAGSPYYPDDPFGLNTVQSRYVAAVRDIAIREQVPLVDIYGRFISYANQAGHELLDLIPDGLHPEAAGQRMVAEAIYAVLGVKVPEQPSGVAPEGGQGRGETAPAGAMKFGLEGNYPNPFNPATELVFDLAEAGNARLEVYDVRGRRVKQLADGYFQPGRHRLQWDARDAGARPVAAGIYWACLTTAARMDTHKMMVLR